VVWVSVVIIKRAKISVISPASIVKKLLFHQSSFKLIKISFIILASTKVRRFSPTQFLLR